VSTKNLPAGRQVGRRLSSLSGQMLVREADLAGDVAELVAGNVFELLAALTEFLVELDGLLLEEAVRRFAAADQVKIFTPRHAKVTVLVIQPHTQEKSLPFLFWRIHGADTSPSTVSL